jgi:hypothetical protein
MSEGGPKGWFVWLSEEYSVPAEQVCYRDAPAPNRDFKCIRAAGHEGKCRFSAEAHLRQQSHKDPRS